jgi:hypothetical protein
LAEKNISKTSEKNIMKKHLLFLLLCCMTVLQTKAQNCTNTSVGFPPIMDLGTGYWQGAQGGLYPNGSNYRPLFHNQQGLLIASQIQPLDASGNIDLTNGKIIWLSIGMSNTTMETQVFIPMADTFQNKNPKLDLIDGAQGGQDINIIINPNDNFWQVINNRLAQAGYTPSQVQAVWFKEAEAQPSDTSFATYPGSLKNKYRTVMQIIKTKFPNTKLCYLSNRIYAGYATTTLNPEPFAYYTGWTVKRLIEDQVNGDTSLAYSGGNIRSPWLSWGPDLWADGTTPRSDGLTWICPGDYNTDGTHPSLTGRQKVANLLFSFFTTDSTSVPWFLTPTATGIINGNNQQLFSFYPDPALTEININLPSTNNFTAEIINSIGGTVSQTQNQTRIDVSQLPGGIYFLKVKTADNFYSRKFIKKQFK